ncbi:hypothetical protein PCAR4_1360019 [Paraburkholderia caribensis]|jgi:hypothetical protein|nr:hypothetical protein PCAR4_1360019 [Paraburkholderia caribensis]
MTRAIYIVGWSGSYRLMLSLGYRPLPGVDI